MKKKLFNYNCPTTKKGSTTGIINGCSDGIINLNNLSYRWAYNLWEMMLANTWFPKEVDLTEDARQYRKLLPSEKRLYDKVLSQLIFMDSIQTNNSVDNVNPWITAPEVNMCIVRQSYEEALHSQSYAVMVDSISMNTDEIYEMWRTDKELKSKNEFIGNVYEKYGQRAIDGDDEAKIYMIIANQCLEGIYFYSGFAGIYVLARAGKMLGSAQMIRFIQRDEVTHLQLFANIYKEIQKENPSLYNELEEKANLLMEGFKEGAKKAGVNIQTTVRGSMFGFFFSDKKVKNFEDASKCDAKFFAKFHQGMLEEGIYLARSLFETGFISAAHQEKDIKKSITAAKKVLKAIS
jgi:ribonucleotide reductase beta subunit family protein with ferritin-like domain